MMPKYTYFCNGPYCPVSVVVEVDGPITSNGLAHKFEQHNWLAAIAAGEETLPTNKAGQPMIGIDSAVYCSEGCAELHADFREAFASAFGFED